ncbi:MAG: FAD-dependent oxidoreductase [Clostridia bacterium]|nr:FAD-dependent oxidoreductase [Clostridia bacterium]
MKTVIIGGVASGATCAARLRRLDEQAEIVLLERGEYISYANCGLPYFIGGTIKNRSALLVQTTEQMRNKFRIDVRTHSEAVSIDRAGKTVTIRRNDGTEYEETYDKLVIATGSTPVRPRIPGIDSDRIHTLWTVPDADKIKALTENAKEAVVIGGGFIGVEMAEQLRHFGLAVTLVEGTDQIMAPFDPEMVRLLHRTLTENGVDLILSDPVDSFEETDNGIRVNLKTGRSVEADFAVLSIGIRPNTAIAKNAGLDVTDRGFIEVSGSLKTSDPDIYACGDIISYPDLALGGKTTVQLAGPANKQGRIVADNIAGLLSVYRGAQGTSVTGVFGLQAASTGANEKKLQSRGLVRGKDYESVIITQNNHAGYYPGASQILMKLLFSCDGTKIYGAQAIGADGADKRIDVIATAMRLGAGVSELTELELGYSPAHGSAKDPVNMIGFTAENVIRGLVKFSAYQPDLSSAKILDIREDPELMAYEIPGALHIPLSELRNRLYELDRMQHYIVICAVGVRSYNAARILSMNGFPHVQVYPGGLKLYRAIFDEDKPKKAAAASLPAAAAVGAVKTSVSLDCCGMQCPGPLMKVYEAVNAMQEGDVLDVSASDPGFARDIAAWCSRTGNTLLSQSSGDGRYSALVQKGTGQAAPVVQKDTEDGKTIIVFSGDFDKVMASFIIANGAAAMGRKVTMFFTFWGLTALRRQENVKVKKSFMERMFGFMLPRGFNKLGLSRMNMAGMGTAMMKKIMNDKNVNTLEDLVKKAMENGVHIMACSMSMDVMGIHPEELIDGVEIVGVGTYLGSAEESNVNLFI